MIPEPAHVISAIDLVVPEGTNYASAPAAQGYLAAVRRFEGTFEGSLRGRGVELLSDGRIRSLPALGLTPDEARGHAYELLVAADVKESR